MIALRNQSECGGLRAAGRAAARVLASLKGLVTPGVTTAELDVASLEFMAGEACVSAFRGYRGFPGNICVSVNEEVVHGIGGSRRLQVGDIVKLDVGVLKAGWIGDTAATVCVGGVSECAVRLLAVTEKALQAGIKCARHGTRLGDLGAEIQAGVEGAGFSVVREFVGHGVGRSLHEEPQVPNFGKRGTGVKLKAGMVLAIEPMVNVGGAAVRVLADDWTVVTRDGSLSAHFEHTVLVGHGDAEILTVC
ncbi:MAG: Methionine aminopeptidase 1 [Verrucomicrobiota bacterium]